MIHNNTVIDQNGLSKVNTTLISCDTAEAYGLISDSSIKNATICGKTMIRNWDCDYPSILVNPIINPIILDDRDDGEISPDEKGNFSPVIFTPSVFKWLYNEIRFYVVVYTDYINYLEKITKNGWEYAYKNANKSVSCCSSNTNKHYWRSLKELEHDDDKGLRTTLCKFLKENL
jgi:hypothetical protein